eukprot:TCONS_00052203-protein
MSSPPTSPPNIQQCECSGCEIDGIKNLNEDFRMTPCPDVTNACKTIRKLLKKGFVLKPSPQTSKQVREVDYFDEMLSRSELIESLTHTLVLWHPNRTTYIKFILARYRSCVGVHELYKTHGFYVSDNRSIALLRFKNNKKLSCYFIDFESFEVKHTDINIEFIDKDMCSIYLYGGSLWIVQNSSDPGVIHVAHIRLKENPVRCFARQFGTMDYWNPFTPGQVIFTDTDLYHEFLRVTLDTKRTKIIRKYVSTLKNSFLIPVGNRLVNIDYDYKIKEILFQFSSREDKVKTLKTMVLKTTFELSKYSFAFSNISNLIVIRLNKKEVVVLDTINCCVVKNIHLNRNYDLNHKIHFLFSPNGKRVLVLGPVKNTGQHLWTQHLLCSVRTLKMSALRSVRQTFAIDDLKKCDIPKMLRYELNFGRS